PEGLEAERERKCRGLPRAGPRDEAPLAPRAHHVDPERLAHGATEREPRRVDVELRDAARGEVRRLEGDPLAVVRDEAPDPDPLSSGHASDADVTRRPPVRAAEIVEDGLLPALVLGVHGVEPFVLGSNPEGSEVEAVVGFVHLAEVARPESKSTPR